MNPTLKRLKDIGLDEMGYVVSPVVGLSNLIEIYHHQGRSIDGLEYWLQHVIDAAPGSLAAELEFVDDPAMRWQRLCKKVEDGELVVVDDQLGRGCE
jgi:hypothetical protein